MTSVFINKICIEMDQSLENNRNKNNNAESKIFYSQLIYINFVWKQSKDILNTEGLKKSIVHSASLGELVKSYFQQEEWIQRLPFS